MITKINEPGGFVLLEENSVEKDMTKGATKKKKTKTQRKRLMHHKIVL